MSKVLTGTNYVIVGTVNQANLAHVDLRLNSLRIHNPESSEYARFKAIREDLLSRLTEAELAEYNARTGRKKTAAEIAAEQAALVKQMNENKDKPSI